jgi:P4 family phage/plasmid primase-like protien
MSLAAALSPGGALSALSAYRRFIVYKLVWMPEKGKHDKIPVDFKSGHNANAHDTTAQTDWQTAIMAAERLGRDFGVGFVFTAADGFFFLDIDNCLQEGSWSPLAMRLLSMFAGAAVEVSVSGKGLHVFGRAAIIPHRSKNIPLGIELYHDGRFVALTGSGAIGNAAQDCSTAFASVVTEYFPPAAEEAFTWTDLNIPVDQDEALIARMISSRSVYSFFGDKAAFADLWFAKEDVLARNYPDSGKRTFDASSVDMALAQHLAFWTRKDCARMWRIMWHPECKLRRQKWHDRPAYVRDTILTACARQTEVLSERMQPVMPGAPAPAEALSGVAEIAARAPVALCLTTDQGNAKRISAAFGTRIMYSAGGWFGWDGTRWVPDMNYVWECAQQLSTLVRAEAQHWRARAEAMRAANHPEGGMKEDQNADNLEKYIPQAESHEKKNLALAELSKLSAINIDEIDSHEFILNTLSGHVDLRTGGLSPHDSSRRITKVVPVKFDANATCPQFEEFLAQIMLEDHLPQHQRLKVKFLQRWVGYCATGSCREQKFAVHFGNGSNGKSTLIDVIASIMGTQYACEAAPDMLTGKGESKHPTDIADLRGRRMVTSSESKFDELLKEDFIKRATGGDRLKGRLMRQDFFEFKPTHKLQLLTNHKPRIMGTDYAIWRRVCLIPYLASFGTKEDVAAGRCARIKNENLAEALKLERQGILNWIIQGAKDWFSGGLNPPEEVVAATDEYRNDQDSIGQFVRDQCELGQEFCVPLHGAAGFSECLYPRYQIWAKENGMMAMGSRKFESEVKRCVPAARIYRESRKSDINGRTVQLIMIKGIR